MLIFYFFQVLICVLLQYLSIFYWFVCLFPYLSINSLLQCTVCPWLLGNVNSDDVCVLLNKREKSIYKKKFTDFVQSYLRIFLVVFFLLSNSCNIGHKSVYIFQIDLFERTRAGTLQTVLFFNLKTPTNLSNTRLNFHFLVCYVFL